MKNIIKTTILFVLVLTMAAGIPFSVYAASSDDQYETTSKEPEPTRSVNIGTAWTTVISSNSGFNRNVTISATTFTLNGLFSTVPCDIRLLGVNDQELWYSGSAVPGNGSETIFWCGSDVRKVQIRTTAGTGVCSAW